MELSRLEASVGHRQMRWRWSVSWRMRRQTNSSRCCRRLLKCVLLFYSLLWHFFSKVTFAEFWWGYHAFLKLCLYNLFVWGSAHTDGFSRCQTGIEVRFLIDSSTIPNEDPSDFCSKNHPNFVVFKEDFERSSKAMNIPPDSSCSMAFVLLHPFFEAPPSRASGPFAGGTQTLRVLDFEETELVKEVEARLSRFLKKAKMSHHDKALSSDRQ